MKIEDCGRLAPLEPAATVEVVGAVVRVFGPMNIVPLAGKVDVEATLIVPVGKATLLEPAAIVVEPEPAGEILVIKKAPEFLYGYRGLFSTSILPTSEEITPRIATGIETSIAAPLLAILALLPTGKVGATVGVVSPVANRYCPMPFMLKLVSPT